MAGLRRLSRIKVMQALFAFYKQEKQEQTVDELLDYILSNLKPDIESFSFAKNLIKGVQENLDSINEIITKKAPQWPLDKIAPVDRALLQIGTYEIVYDKDVPGVVSINEAIEIAKEYGDTNSPKFINGVLSNVLEEYSPDEKTKEKPNE